MMSNGSSGPLTFNGSPACKTSCWIHKKCEPKRRNFEIPMLLAIPTVAAESAQAAIFKTSQKYSARNLGPITSATLDDSVELRIATAQHLTWAPRLLSQTQGYLIMYLQIVTSVAGHGYLADQGSDALPCLPCFENAVKLHELEVNPASWMSRPTIGAVDALSEIF